MWLSRGADMTHDGKRRLNYIWNSLKWILLIALLVVSLFPIIWLVISSFKTNLEIQAHPFALPDVLQFVNYWKALSMASLPRLFLNSVLVAVLSVMLNIAVTSFASFVLSREAFKGRETIYTLLTAGVLIPIIAFMVPYFSTMTKLRLLDSLTALVLVYSAVNIPVSIFLITGYMKSIPRELEEAALIDGCSFYERFFKIVLPLSRSGIVTAGTFCFIYAWNEFNMAMLLTKSLASRTMQVGIRFFTSQFITDYGSMYAAIVMTIVPSIVAYAFLHDRIIGGLTAGSVKG